MADGFSTTRTVLGPAGVSVRVLVSFAADDCSVAVIVSSSAVREAVTHACAWPLLLVLTVTEAAVLGDVGQAPTANPASPAVVNFTAAPGTRLPLASFTVATASVCEAPSAGNDDAPSARTTDVGA